MKLIGSKASPFVRRIRLQLGKKPFEFQTLNVFSEEGQELIRRYSPTGRVPILVDEGTVIWDSLLISEYLSNRPLDREVKKELTLINEMSDAGIQLFQLRKFELDKTDESIFSKNNLKRIEQVLDFFEQRNLSEWTLVEQWLYCTLDWFDFREVYDWREGREKLVEFMHKNCQQDFIEETAP